MWNDLCVDLGGEYEGSSGSKKTPRMLLYLLPRSSFPFEVLMPPFSPQLAVGWGFPPGSAPGPGGGSLACACFLGASSGLRSLIESRFRLRAPRGRGRGRGRGRLSLGMASLFRASRLSPVTQTPGSRELGLVSPSLSCSFESADACSPSPLTSEPSVPGRGQNQPLADGAGSLASGPGSGWKGGTQDEPTKLPPSSALLSWPGSGL